MFQETYVRSVETDLNMDSSLVKSALSAAVFMSCINSNAMQVLLTVNFEYLIDHMPNGREIDNSNNSALHAVKISRNKIQYYLHVYMGFDIFSDGNNITENKYS